jgi:hypothetical protein
MKSCRFHRESSYVVPAARRRGKRQAALPARPVDGDSSSAGDLDLV